MRSPDSSCGSCPSSWRIHAGGSVGGRNESRRARGREIAAQRTRPRWRRPVGPADTIDASRRQIRHAYWLISTGQLDELVAQFAPDALFSFPGEHALGGEFRGPDAVRTWFAEVRRLFPDFRLEPRRIVIARRSRAPAEG
ncbi:MAG: nuclear transport factor 2 family protein [Rhodospirillaceae bacterium]